MEKELLFGIFQSQFFTNKVMGYGEYFNLPFCQSLYKTLDFPNPGWMQPQGASLIISVQSAPSLLLD